MNTYFSLGSSDKHWNLDKVINLYLEIVKANINSGGRDIITPANCITNKVLIGPNPYTFETLARILIK